ncbi:hypothetical protein LWI29_016766 [Acer saccharum]|uniref:Pentatricopeptide repeat-containing protein n=1 Tax=Acer saccharum TaxID=4024 RepID=A0AA39UTP7_ACESA|nr:hypothetical protein LWI29_016766 [Acer saccharum]
MINGYILCGDIASVRLAPERDVVILWNTMSWNTVLGGCERLFEEMPERNVFSLNGLIGGGIKALHLWRLTQNQIRSSIAKFMKCLPVTKPDSTKSLPTMKLDSNKSSMNFRRRAFNKANITILFNKAKPTSDNFDPTLSRRLIRLKPGKHHTAAS